MNQFIQRYKDLKERVSLLEEDIKCTNRALKNKKIDYLTKREYQNDLIEDHKQLHMANAELNQMIMFLLENGLIEEIQFNDSKEKVGKSK